MLCLVHRYWQAQPQVLPLALFITQTSQPPLPMSPVKGDSAAAHSFAPPFFCSASISRRMLHPLRVRVERRTRHSPLVPVYKAIRMNFAMCPLARRSGAPACVRRRPVFHRMPHGVTLAYAYQSGLISTLRNLTMPPPY
jgi:hypothetical protein